jgi:predicted nucleic acid-binding protein
MHCLDTNVIIEYLRGNKKVAEKIKKLAEAEEIFTTTISLCELYKGLCLSPKANTELFVLDNFAQSVNVLDLNLQICRKFGERHAFLSRSGKMISEFDLMIAVIADANNMVLVTMDKKHFANAGARIEVW